MFKWHIVNSADYHAGNKVSDHLYFLQDTGEIYRGAEPFTESVVLYTTLPNEHIAINRLYINSETLEGKIFNGTTWRTVIQPASEQITVVDEIETDPTKDQSNPVNSKAVIAYVAAKLAELTPASDIISALNWDAGNKLLEITMADGTAAQSITFNGLGVELNYNPTTGKLTMVDASGNQLGNAINLDLERFVKSGEYNPQTKKIILYFDDEKTSYVEIDAADLVDIYEAGEDTSSIHVDVTDNKITAEIRISAENGNTLILKPDGLYVAPVNAISKVEDAVKGNIPVFTNDGQVEDSLFSIDDLVKQNQIVKKGKVSSKIESSSDKKVISEKAFVAALTWIEGMGDNPVDNSATPITAASVIANAGSGDTVYVEAGSVEDAVVVTNVDELNIDGDGTVFNNGLTSSAKTLNLSDVVLSNGSMADGQKFIADFGGDEVNLNNVTVTDNGVETRSAIGITAGVFTVEDCIFDGTSDNIYNTFEGHYGSSVVEHAVFKNCVFRGNAATNNFISLYDFTEGAIVEFENCTFEFDGGTNAIRFSNISGNHVTVIVKNCKMKSTNDGEYAGFMLFQDGSKDKSQDMSKITVNFINFTNFAGKKYMNNDGVGVDKIWYTYNTDTVPNVTFS